ncbi:MAG: hypothetical protein AB7D37_09985 [Desulfovibrio sp.]
MRLDIKLIEFSNIDVIAVHCRSDPGKILGIVDTLIDPGAYDITFLSQPVHEVLPFPFHNISSLE